MVTGWIGVAGACAPLPAVHPPIVGKHEDAPHPNLVPRGSVPMKETGLLWRIVLFRSAQVLCSI